MAYTETTTTSYGSRVASSFKGILTGIVLFIGATILLWWNEGRAVKTTKMLKEAQGVTIMMENPETKDASFEGELVCATAMALTEDFLTDDQYGIRENAIGLCRKVEYYQYVEDKHEETRDKIGGGQETITTYTYSKKWVSRPVDSYKFKDPSYKGENFVLSDVEDQSVWAQNVSFGAYYLPDNLIRSISSRENIELNPGNEILNNLNNRTKSAYESYKGKLPISADSTSAEIIHIDGNELYYGLTPNAPQIGDVRVRFEKVVPAKVTIIAQVTGNTFKPYKAKNDKTFSTLVMGQQSIEEIYEGEHQTNAMWTWILRILGVILVISGLKGIFGIVETLFKVLPFLANIMGFGIKIVCSVIGFAWSLIIIALAWVFYRPVLGIALLIVAGGLIWLFAFKGKDKIKGMTNKNDIPAQPASN